MSFHIRGPITLNDLFANDSLFTLGISSFMYILFYLNNLILLLSFSISLRYGGAVPFSALRAALKSIFPVKNCEKNFIKVFQV